MGIPVQNIRRLITIFSVLVASVCFLIALQPIANRGWTRKLKLQPNHPNQSKSRLYQFSSGDTEYEKACTSLLHKKSNVSKLDYKKQVIAATPGSGSDYCRLSLVAITGFYSGSVYEVLNMTDIRQQPKLPFFYKTHYPFIPSVGAVDDYINQRAERAVVVIRNPFDAAFSDWIRQKSETTNKRLKYYDLENVITDDCFWKPGEKLRTIAYMLPEFKGYLEWYLETWVAFHDYWFTTYKRKVKVMLYESLASDRSKFVDVVQFFGYDPYLSDIRQERLSCALNTSFTSTRKRPYSATIDGTKAIIKDLYKDKTQDAISIVKIQFQNRFNSSLTLE